MNKDPNLDSLCSQTPTGSGSTQRTVYTVCFPLCVTEADGWGPTLQSGANQLIGWREIDMLPAEIPSSRLAVHQTPATITPLIGQC